MSGPVLLVHDDIAQIAAVRRLLVREGYEVVLATSAADAVIAFGHYLPALIVLAPSVEGGRGQVVVEELAGHPEARLARILLLGETIPGFAVPVVPLPLDGATFLAQVAEVARSSGSVEGWQVTQPAEVAIPLPAPVPVAEPDEWRATNPRGAAPPLGDSDWELAAMSPEDQQRVMRVRQRAEQAEAAAMQVMAEQSEQVEAEAVASVDDSLGYGAQGQQRTVMARIGPDGVPEILNDGPNVVALPAPPRPQDESWVGYEDPVALAQEQAELTRQRDAEAMAEREIEQNAQLFAAQAAQRVSEADDASDRAHLAAQAEGQRLLEEEQQRLAEAEAQRQFEEEQLRLAAEAEAQRQFEEEQLRLAAEAEAQRQFEEEQLRLAAEAEAQRQFEEEQLRLAAEAEAQRQFEEEQLRLAAETEAQRQFEEEQLRLAAEAEAQRQFEEEQLRLAAEAEAQRQFEEEQLRLAAEAEAQAQRQFEEEQLRLAAEAEAQRQFEEEQLRLAAEAEAQAQRQFEEEQLRLAAEAEEQAQRQFEEEQLRLAAEAQAQRQFEEEQLRLAAEAEAQAQRQFEEEQLRLAAEAQAQRQFEEEQLRLAAEAEAQAERQFEEEQLRLAAEAEAQAQRQSEEEQLRLAAEAGTQAPSPEEAQRLADAEQAEFEAQVRKEAEARRVKKRASQAAAKSERQEQLGQARAEAQAEAAQQAQAARVEVDRAAAEASRFEENVRKEAAEAAADQKLHPATSPASLAAKLFGDAAPAVAPQVDESPLGEAAPRQESADRRAQAERATEDEIAGLMQEQTEARQSAERLTREAEERSYVLREVESRADELALRELEAHEELSRARRVASSARSEAGDLGERLQRDAEEALLRTKLVAEEEARRADREKREKDQLAQQLDHTRRETERISREAADARARREAEDGNLKAAQGEAARAAAEARHLMETAVLPLERPGKSPLKVPKGGTVSLEKLANLVIQLSLARADVRLELKVSDALRTLWLQRGKLVAASSTLSHESLLDRARRDGLIDGRQETELRLLRSASPKEILWALKERRYVREQEAVPLVQRFTEQVALEAFSEGESLYRLAEEPLPEDLTLAGTPRSTVHLLADAVRRTLSPERSLFLLGGLDAQLVRVDDGMDPRDVGYSERERRLFVELDGHPTVQDVLMLSGLSQEATLKALALGKVLGLVDSIPSDRPVLQVAVADSDLRRLQAKFEQLQESDYFAVLGLTRSAGQDEVQRAFQTLSTEFDPIRFVGHQDPALQLQARQIQEALSEAAQALQDDRLRNEYARHLTD